MPEPLREYLVAARDALTEQITAIDHELQRLAGQTPEERRAFMRRMTRRITLPGAWLLAGAAVAYTWLRRHPARATFAAGLILGALVVWALLPAPAPPVPPPPDRAVPSPTAAPPSPGPTPSPTPSPPAPPTPTHPSPGGVGATPTGPPGPGTPTSPPGPGPTTSPPPPEERERARCLRLRPTPAVDLPRCVERIGELIDG